MDNLIEFPRMKKADDLAEKLTASVIIEAQKLGLNTLDPDFVLIWHGFINS